MKRVGERIAEGLTKRGVETVEDLLYHLPFRYEDRLNPRSIAEMKAASNRRSISPAPSMKVIFAAGYDPAEPLTM